MLRYSPEKRKYEVLISLSSVRARIQISDLFLCDPKGTRSGNILNILILDKGVILILFTEDKFTTMLHNGQYILENIYDGLRHWRRLWRYRILNDCPEALFNKRGVESMRLRIKSH
jgi:hypothetical protein